MDWSDLQVLLAFEREGTLKRAADAMHVNISTVSRRIRALEESVGVSLVENVSGRLVLTPAGQDTVSAAARMKSESDSLLRSLTDRDDSVEGTIRVGLLEITVLCHADVFRRFSDRYPAIQLELLVAGPYLHSLNQREADVVLRVTRTPSDTLVGRRVGDYRYRVYAHPLLVARHGEHWETMPFLGWTREMGARETEAWMREHGCDQRIVARVGSSIALFGLASAGMGACIIPDVYAGDLGLVAVSEPIESFTTSMWVLTHRDLRRNARIRAFTDFMVEELRRELSAE